MGTRERGEEIGWQVGKSVINCNAYMFEHKLATDVCFVVGLPDRPTVELKAHKYVLISRSPVFEAMLCGKLSENLDDETAKIRINDIDPDAFQEVLRYRILIFYHIHLCSK